MLLLELLPSKDFLAGRALNHVEFIESLAVCFWEHICNPIVEAILGGLLIVFLIVHLECLWTSFSEHFIEIIWALQRVIIILLYIYLIVHWNHSSHQRRVLHRFLIASRFFVMLVAKLLVHRLLRYPKPILWEALAAALITVPIQRLVRILNTTRRCTTSECGSHVRVLVWHELVLVLLTGNHYVFLDTCAKAHIQPILISKVIRFSCLNLIVSDTKTAQVDMFEIIGDLFDQTSHFLWWPQVVATHVLPLLIIYGLLVDVADIGTLNMWVRRTISWFLKLGNKRDVLLRNLISCRHQRPLRLHLLKSRTLSLSNLVCLHLLLNLQQPLTLLLI